MENKVSEKMCKVRKSRCKVRNNKLARLEGKKGRKVIRKKGGSQAKLEKKCPMSKEKWQG